MARAPQEGRGVSTAPAGVRGGHLFEASFAVCVQSQVTKDADAA